MKHNGFTLVEMMAVIVLVAILSVVAVSTYRGVNESAKNKTLESKITEIKTAAVKWAKENNITNKTVISVNALVVEGYITADENEIDELPIIENPVTGENMICNTVDISFDQGEAKAVYNENVQNCDLATQSLVDTNISIRVIDENNMDKTGSGSIANWTNKNVMVVVTSTQYDSKAVSISYDFEGNTTTKSKSGLQQYTGNAYIKEQTEYDKYYNVFKIDANLLLDSKVIVTYNIAGELSKSRAYTIRIDKEEATATIESNSEWLAEDKPITVKVDDGKGSGPKYFYITSTETFENYKKYTADYKGVTADLKIGKYYIWTEDKAGNRSQKYKMVLDVNNVDNVKPECEVLFDGTLGDHGWYKKDPVTPIGKNSKKAGVSGVNIGVNTTENSPEYIGFAMYDTIIEARGKIRNTNTQKNGLMYYCHVRSLAGLYAKNNKRLYLDMTEPTINVSVTQPSTHTQTKTATITIQDTLSGLNANNNFRYGFSLSSTIPPTNWTSFSINTTNQNNSAVTGKFTTSEKLTGTYYLWIDTSGFKDYAGNYALSPQSVNETEFVYGPYKFDNTPPVCNGNNGKTIWKNGEYTIKQLCIDNDETTDQSGCTQDVYTKNYSKKQTVKTDSLTIVDKAGNFTVCPFDVYQDNTIPTCKVNINKKVDGKNGWYVTDVPLSLNTADLDSGVEVYGLSQSEKDDYNNQNTATQTTNNDMILWYGYVRDIAGNTNSCVSKNFKLDKTPPHCWFNVSPPAIGDDGWYIRNVNTGETKAKVRIDFADNFDLITYYHLGTIKNENKPTSKFRANNYTSYIVPENRATAYIIEKDQGDTKGTVWYGSVEDEAGNTSTCQTEKIKLDSVPPTCRITLSGKKGDHGWYKQREVQVTLHRSADATSGRGSYGLSPVSAPNYTATSTKATQGDTVGVTWYGYVRDKAGNVNSCDSGPFKVDTIAPTCVITNPGDQCRTVGVSVTINCSDNAFYGQYSGMAQCANKTNLAGNYNDSFDSPTGAPNLNDRVSRLTGTTSFAMVDLAGNRDTCTVNVTSTKQYQKTYCSTSRWCEWNCKTKEVCTEHSKTYDTGGGYPSGFAVGACQKVADSGSTVSGSAWACKWTTCEDVTTCSSSGRNYDHCGCSSGGWTSSDWSNSKLTCRNSEDGCSIDDRTLYSWQRACN